MESCQDGRTCVECLAQITFVPAWPPTQLTVLVIPECAENLTIEIPELDIEDCRENLSL